MSRKSRILIEIFFIWRIVFNKIEFENSSSTYMLRLHTYKTDSWFLSKNETWKEKMLFCIELSSIYYSNNLIFAQ